MKLNKSLNRNSVGLTDLLTDKTGTGQNHREWARVNQD